MTKTASSHHLWTCPRCGAKLVTRNLWHSCGRATVDDWLARVGAPGRALYDRFETLVAACGSYHVAPAKTRIAFLGLVRFAGITRLSDRGMTCDFALPYRVRSNRFAKVDEVAAGWFVHRLRVTAPEQLDEQLQRWIARSYTLMGMRRRLESPRPRTTRTPVDHG